MSRLLYVTFLFQSPRDHPDLHSFPTRRSSDLQSGHIAGISKNAYVLTTRRGLHWGRGLQPTSTNSAQLEPTDREGRSEEHTSELQSLTNLVCRLLLEKKKKTHTNTCTEDVTAA